MRLTDHAILIGLLPADTSLWWQVIGDHAYASPTPDSPVRITLAVHRSPTTRTPLGLTLRAVHLERGELDATVLPFDQDGYPWQVADINFTSATVRPGPCFDAYFQPVRAYRDLWERGRAQSSAMGTSSVTS
ncbi:hypothetical protein [Streptomyces sp. MZ04]|uniref:hypothetical protein n=1 Tax=Streptomyces sp. MZ04 TaxID=2559236 RepID=UPI00107E7952|nr:hypothetical protein [Streptomyces sp. MZ04]TGB00870.1 hypothetical protein E2651_28210 [Streptomyces sp. MZ04]